MSDRIQHVEVRGDLVYLTTADTAYVRVVEPGEDLEALAQHYRETRQTDDACRFIGTWRPLEGGGDVVDVQYIIGETAEPKISERLSFPA